MKVNDRQKRLIEDGLRNEIRRQKLLTPAMAYVANCEDERGEYVLVSFGTQNVIGEAWNVKAGSIVKTPIAYEIRGTGSPTLDIIEHVLDCLFDELMGGKEANESV